MKEIWFPFPTLPSSCSQDQRVSWLTVKEQFCESAMAYTMLLLWQHYGPEGEEWLLRVGFQLHPRTSKLSLPLEWASHLLHSEHRRDCPCNSESRKAAKLMTLTLGKACCPFDHTVCFPHPHPTPTTASKPQYGEPTRLTVQHLLNILSQMEHGPPPLLFVCLLLF